MQNVPNQQLTEIQNQVTNLIADLNKAVNWGETFLKTDAQKKYLSKVKKIRRELKSIKYAVSQRPSAAMYGESQVGKSYLVKNLLSQPKEKFTIRDYSIPREVDYIDEINPRGGGTESTSVVTRFSTQVNLIDNNFPIKAKLLSPRDVILMLSDSYYSDVIDHVNLPTDKTIEEHIASLKDKFEDSTSNQEVLDEDDIYEIQDYLSEHFKNPTSALNQSDFWNYCGKIIHKIPHQEWYKVFEIIWGYNSHINKIFSELIDELNTISFSDEIYLEFKAVLRKHGTILGVPRLRELNNAQLFEDVTKENFIPDVKIKFEHQGDFREEKIKKSILCALIAELVFKLDEELEKTKPFLKSSDLLDFPGAQPRLENKEESLTDEFIPQMVLRGKVGYIFHRYSSHFLISNLLFCNYNKDVKATFIPRLLNNWIEKFIGENEKEREEFLSHTPIPPLFIIYTFFNVDLTYKGATDKDADSYLLKWKTRFENIFENQIVKKEENDWHVNWRTSNPNFRNNYMLRDFVESKTVYNGYADNDEEKELIKVKGAENYFEQLRDSFIQHDFVERHFEDPSEMWKESAEINKDGSELIINNLTKISDNYARTQKFIRELNRLSAELKKLLKDKHYDDDSKSQIRKALKESGGIHLEMDYVFGSDPYAFGKFIKQFLITESAVYNLYKDILVAPDLINHSNVETLMLIRASNPDLNLEKSYDDNMSVLIKTYSLSSKEEVEELFKDKNIDLNELFYGDRNQLKNSSLVLAEKLQEFWFEQYLKTERFELFTDNNFSEASLEALFSNLKLSFEELNLAEKISREIREYVDRYDKVAEAIEMIADISASVINKFVNSFGLDFYLDEKLEQLENTNEINQLNLNFNVVKNDDNSEMDDDDIAELFENMYHYNEQVGKVSLDHEIISKFPNIKSYVRWRNLMKISFISNCEIPTYDELANNAIGGLIKTISPYHFDLKTNQPEKISEPNVN